VKRQSVLVEQPLAVRGERAINPGFVHANNFPCFSSKPLAEVVRDVALSK
jgi:hypothetical protein